MAIELIGKIKQKNGGAFFLVDAQDVEYGGKSLVDALKAGDIVATGGGNRMHYADADVGSSTPFDASALTPGDPKAGDLVLDANGELYEVAKVEGATVTPSAALTTEGGATASMRGPAGPAGPQGETGATGPQGPRGEAGEAGPAGPKGDKGDPGKDGTGVSIKGSVASSSALPTEGNAAGDAYITTDDGHMHTWDGSKWVDAGEIKGPKGDQGETGPQGPAGPAGPKGADGKDGAAGAQGPKGERGDPGKDGAQGPQGPAGPGVSTGSGVPTADGVAGQLYIDNDSGLYYAWEETGN